MFNNHGKPRLSKFYEFYVCLLSDTFSKLILFLFVSPDTFIGTKQPEDLQQQIIRETFQLVSKRDENVCNFLEGGRFVSDFCFCFCIL